MDQDFSNSLPVSPVVIRNKIKNWKILKYKETDWIELFKNKVLPFRQGKKTYKSGPYWEQLCEEKELTMEQFFKHSTSNCNDWLYFGYKCLKNFCPSDSDICKDINWSDLNLKDCPGGDSTIWIGNKDAHTPCHMDTYGCNFVAQIFGRKLWILIPPEETEAMNPVRVPYEESSIYSSHNFYTPNSSLLSIRKAYEIVLNPGEVLFLPRHWWHYVENIDVAISVNTWIPLDVDHESRLEECLVRHYVYNICQELTEQAASQLLNPNEYDLLTASNLIETLQKCVENCLRYRRGEIKQNWPTRQIVAMLTQEPYELKELDFNKYITIKREEHGYGAPADEEDKTERSTSAISLAKSLINAYGHPENLTKFKERLLSQFNSE